MDQAKMVGVLVLARVAAEDSVRPFSDGGTCNMDSCVIVAPPEVNMALACAAAGLGSYYRGGSKKRDMWAGKWFLHAPKGGQGDARTKQAEAMDKVMKEYGIESTVYYQMD
jgi:nitroreductase